MVKIDGLLSIDYSSFRGIYRIIKNHKGKKKSTKHKKGFPESIGLEKTTVYGLRILI